MGSRSGLLATVTLALLAPQWLTAQEKYHDPAPVVARILDAHPTPLVVVSPDRSRLLILERAALPPISDVAGPELRLAGVRLNPRNNAPSNAELFTSLVVQPVKGEVRRIVLPWQSRVGHVMWAPDGRTVGFTLVEATGVSLWVAEASSGEIRLLLGPVLNAALGNPCRWLPSGNGLLCSRVPADRSAPPADSDVPIGPIVRDSRVAIAPVRSDQDLLQNPGDDALFEHYFESQLVIVPLSGPVRPVGPVGVHASAAVSPDGRYLLVETMHGPWSYSVAWPRFGRRTAVWDINGQPIREVADRAALEGAAQPGDSVPGGPRGIGWRADAPAILAWFEAQTDGGAGSQVGVRDRLVLLSAPFSGGPVVMAELGSRAVAVTWSRPTLAIVAEQGERTRRTRTWAVDPSHPGAPPRLLSDRALDDQRADPGRFLLTPSSAGDSLLLTSKDGRFAFLAGRTSTPDGDRAFLDRLDLTSGRALRLFRSEGPMDEMPVAMLDAEAGRFLSRRQSTNEPANYFIRELRKQPAAQLTQITGFADHAPEFAGTTKERVNYTSPDGAERSAILYLPSGYDRGKGPLPLLVWARGESGEVGGPPSEFVRPSGASPLFLLLSGYGVVDWPADAGEGNGEVLAGSARALIERLVGMGVAERGRIGIGGELSGATAAVELMGRPDLFKAGIAVRLPGTVADSIRGPLLMVQGVGGAGTGPGTAQVERSYAGVLGRGEIIRLVLLPGERGSIRARESVGQVLFEMAGWMEKYVKQ